MLITRKAGEPIYVLVSSARQKEEEIIAVSSKTMNELLAIEKKLEIVRRELTFVVGCVSPSGALR